MCRLEVKGEGYLANHNNGRGENERAGNPVGSVLALSSPCYCSGWLGRVMFTVKGRNT
jgi:hypothetical protein